MQDVINSYLYCSWWSALILYAPVILITITGESARVQRQARCLRIRASVFNVDIDLADTNAEALYQGPELPYLLRTFWYKYGSSDAFKVQVQCQLETFEDTFELWRFVCFCLCFPASPTRRIQIQSKSDQISLLAFSMVSSEEEDVYWRWMISLHFRHFEGWEGVKLHSEGQALHVRPFVATATECSSLKMVLVSYILLEAGMKMERMPKMKELFG